MAKCTSNNVKKVYGTAIATYLLNKRNFMDMGNERKKKIKKNIDKDRNNKRQRNNKMK
jgi:hypothetical protein